MAERKKMPEIRFKGFTGDWEERTLGEVITFINGRAYNQRELLNSGKYKVLRVGNFYTNDSWYYSEMELDEKYYANKGDLLYTWSASFGPHIWNSNKVIYHYHIWKLVLSECLNIFFAFHLLNNDKKKILNDKNGSTMVHITKVGMEKKFTFIPKIDEQAQIGSFFQRLDNLITLHQRKYEKLVNVKKSMLEKMFPKDGADVPEIRFKGFTGKWEKNRLGEICVETYGGGTPRTSELEYWNGDIPWIQSSDLVEKQLSEIVPKKRITEKGLRNSATKLIPENSIAIVTRVGVGKLAFMPYSYATSQDFLSLSKLKIDNWFGVYSIWKKLQSELHEVQGTSIKGITKEELLAKRIVVPQKNEQKKIGEFFKQIDNLITLHQQELDKLKNIKKACLEKMFV